MNAAAIARELHARKTGARWIARCVAHDDSDPSLSISEHNGTVLVKCFAGCSQTEVINALRERGLWSPKERRSDDWGPIVAEYDYRDEAGNLLYTICRFHDKQFRPRLPDGRWGYHGTRRVLYRLPEVLEAAILFVVEGEKDVETLRSHGFVATTNPGGANGWRAEFNECFKGREVIIIPDNDPPGRARALHIARGVLPYAANVRYLELSDGKDVTDWFQAGHSEVELIAQLEGCHAYCSQGARRYRGARTGVADYG